MFLHDKSPEIVIGALLWSSCQTELGGSTRLRRPEGRNSCRSRAAPNGPRGSWRARAQRVYRRSSNAEGQRGWVQILGPRSGRGRGM